jgi:hypothetical protein
MRPEVRDLGRVGVLWIGFLIATNLIGEASMRELRVVPETRWRAEQIATQNRWVRWDALWYLRIAEEGYRYEPDKNEETSSVGFLPLYPLAIRALAWVTPFDAAGAGLWISRLALLASMWLLVMLARMRGLDDDRAFAPAVALLFFPTAYILGAVYADALFVALAIGAFVLAEKGRFPLAAIAAFLAGATRIHGLVLALGLFVLGILEWRRAKSWLAFLPAIAAGLGVASYGVFTWIQFGDPLLYLHHRSAWDQDPREPVGPLVHFFGYFTADYVPIRRFVQVALFGGGIAVAIVSARRKRWADAALIAGLFAMNLVSGTLDGTERYLLFCFPIFLLLAERSRNRFLWPAYLFAGALMQAFNIFRYVNYQTPPP